MLYMYLSKMLWQHSVYALKSDVYYLPSKVLCLYEKRCFLQAWDDVVRKVKPIEKPFEYKRSLNTDQEKSKLSLAEIYEKEYIKQTEVCLLQLCFFIFFYFML